MLHEKTVEPATLELLIKLMADPLLSDFFLVGGTALALQIGHRRSIDLVCSAKKILIFADKMTLAAVKVFNKWPLLKIPGRNEANSSDPL